MSSKIPLIPNLIKREILENSTEDVLQTFHDLDIWPEVTTLMIRAIQVPNNIPCVKRLAMSYLRERKVISFENLTIFLGNSSPNKDLNLKDAYIWAITGALGGGHFDLYKKLLIGEFFKNQSITARDSQAILSGAGASGNIEVIDNITRSLSSYYKIGCDPIYWGAAGAGHIHVIEWLIKKNPTYQYRFSSPEAISEARKWNQEETIEWIKRNVPKKNYELPDNLPFLDTYSKKYGPPLYEPEYIK